MEGQLSLFDDLFGDEFQTENSSNNSMAIPNEEGIKVETITPSVGEELAFSIGNIVEKFDAINIKSNSFISEEDKEFCEGQQQRIEAAVSLLLKAKQFYKEHELSNIYLSTKNLIKDLDAKLDSKVESFVKKIVEHFRSTYDVSINKSKMRKFDHTVSYNDIVDEILLQMDGMNFLEKAHAEIKEAVRKTIYDSSKVQVKSSKVTIAGYLLFETWGIKSFYNKRLENLQAALRGIELFDSGCTSLRNELKGIIYNHARDDWFEEFNLSSMEKIKSFRCLRNGKLEISFNSYELALQFAKEYLKYS